MPNGSPLAAPVAPAPPRLKPREVAFDPPRLKPREVAFANLILGREPALTAQIGDKAVALRLASGIGDGSHASRLAVSARLDGAPAQLDLDRAALAALLPDVAVPDTPEDLPRVLLAALGAAALEPLAAAFGNGLSISLTADPEAAAPNGDGQTALVSILPTDAGWRARLSLSTDAAATLVHALKTAPPARRFAAWGRVPAALEAVIAEVQAPLDALRSLDLGDVVLLNPGSDPDRVTLTLRGSGQRIAYARIEGAKATIEEMFPMAISDKDDACAGEADPEPAPEPTPTPALDDLEIRLTFVLGETALPLDELRALAPGHVFALDAPASGPVSIRAAGREIGRGEIVSINGRVGVRVTGLIAAPALDDDKSDTQ